MYHIRIIEIILSWYHKLEISIFIILFQAHKKSSSFWANWNSSNRMLMLVIYTFVYKIQRGAVVYYQFVRVWGCLVSLIMTAEPRFFIFGYDCCIIKNVCPTYKRGNLTSNAVKYYFCNCPFGRIWQLHFFIFRKRSNS